jgi:hypothetical protein
MPLTVDQADLMPIDRLIQKLFVVSALVGSKGRRTVLIEQLQAGLPIAVAIPPEPHVRAVLIVKPQRRVHRVDAGSARRP